jgi:hypothetical protein
LKTATVWLLLRSFASGCTALTGIEAVSNAIPIFRQPSVVHARRTLIIITAILALLLAGLAYLAHAYGITATPPGERGYQSLISQVVGAVAGRGGWYYLTMTGVLAVLVFSANTSFTDFPRVCRLLALDEFLPAEFAHRGPRLVYSTGIIVLALIAGGLLVAFGGITDRLIPLFAIGAFLAFTFPQLGMVLHWWRRTKSKHSLILNAVGTLVTAGTTLIIGISKFTSGAWISLAVIPLWLLLFWRIRLYHDRIGRETVQDGPVDLADLATPVVVIPIKRLDGAARKALRLALVVARDVRVVQVLAEEIKTENLRERWFELVERPAREAGLAIPKLTIVPSAYREFFGPLLECLRTIGLEYPDRPIAVLIPEVVERRWYHFLFRHRNTLLKGLLLLRGGPRIVLITLPWYVHDDARQRRPSRASHASQAVISEESA